MNAPAADRAATRASRGFQPLRDLPVTAWLATLVIVTLIHPWLPAPRWLMLHLLLLGAISHAIHVWSQYFADALLHAAPTPVQLRARAARLGMHNLGALGVIAGVSATQWPVTAAGGALVGVAAGWHASSLLGQVRGALGSRFATTVRYYVAAGLALVVGASFGILLARHPDDPLHSRLLLAHVSVNLFGWVGLTVLGTVLTLWPTMLRTKMAEGAERSSRQALPVLAVAVAATVLGSVAGAPRVIALGVGGYLLGTAVVAVPMVRTALRKPPATFATMSVAAGLSWLVVVLAGLAVVFATSDSVELAVGGLTWAAPLLAVGFAAQVLLGALSYLVPVALRGGPTPVRAATMVLDRGSPLRVAAANAGIVVMTLPAPSVVRVFASTVTFAALASFLPLLVLAIRAHRRAKGPATTGRTRLVPQDRPAGQLRGLAATGVAGVVLAVAVGVALDPVALTSAAGSGSADAGIPATGITTTVRVVARDMRFHPGSVSVPAGNRLVIEVTNTDDEDVHDLVLDTGARTPRLAPGETATADVGVVGRDLDGWCSVAGHRQMGMVLAVIVTGLPAPPETQAGDESTAHASAHASDEPGSQQQADDQATFDPMAEPGAGFSARDAVLPALGGQRVHRRTFRVADVQREVAPGVTQTLWTYNGTAPGPVLHGRVGDRFVIRLVNDGSIGHSIDFHAGALAPDRPMRTIPPGESLVYRFTATKAGVWMYHCSTMPMSAHIANGLFGAVVIEPKNLRPADRSYLLVQSEYYLGPNGGSVDVDALAAESPDAVVFNGYANQYAFDPLPARVGESVRVWVLAAGPNRATSFHVVGGQFDAVYSEGSYLLRRGEPGGAQALALAPAQGGFAELRFPEPGRYPFVSHVMVDAERGARGLFAVQ